MSTTDGADPSGRLAAVVLAGGAGRRLGGADKPGVEVGGRTLLDHVLLACPEHSQMVVVGPRRPTARAVEWTREDPPGGGPVAGLAAGLRLVDAPLVLVLASDLPRVAAALGPLLQGASRAVAEGVDGAWVVDDTGRGQPLVSCLSSARLRSVMPAEPQGYPLHQVLAQLRLTAVNVPRGSVSDVDTAADLTRLRQDLAQPTQEDHDE